MATIEEDYVSFETAKLLKEKGFDSVCNGYYNQEKVLERVSACSVKDTFKSPFYFDCVPAPTLQMAMKWLREVYNFHIWVEPNHDKEGLYNAHVKVGWWSNNWAGVGYNTYEKATEEAIKYCLKHLIK